MQGSLPVKHAEWHPPYSSPPRFLPAARQRSNLPLKPHMLSPGELVRPTEVTMSILWPTWDLDLDPTSPGHFFDHRRQQSGQTRPFSIHALDASSYRDYKVMILQHAELLNFPGRRRSECRLTRMAKWRRESWRIYDLQDEMEKAISEYKNGVEHAKQGRVDEGLYSLAKSLCLLTPWSSDGTWMTFEAARASGLPQLEYSILSNIARIGLTAVQHIKDTGGSVSRAQRRFGPLILPALSAANIGPFATWGEMRDIMQLMWRQWREGREEDLGELTLAQWGARLSTARKFAHFDAAAWVHADCKTSHTCQETINLLAEESDSIHTILDVNHPAIGPPLHQLYVSDARRAVEDGQVRLFPSITTPDLCSGGFASTPSSLSISTPGQEDPDSSPLRNVRFAGALANVKFPSPMVSGLEGNQNPFDREYHSRKRKRAESDTEGEASNGKSARVRREARTLVP